MYQDWMEDVPIFGEMPNRSKNEMERVISELKEEVCDLKRRVKCLEEKNRGMR